jgi:hypothetical protein
MNLPCWLSEKGKGSGKQHLLLATLTTVLGTFLIAAVYFGKFRPAAQAGLLLAILKARQALEIDQTVGRTFAAGGFVTGRITSTAKAGNADLPDPPCRPEWLRTAEATGATERWKMAHRLADFPL